MLQVTEKQFLLLQQLAQCRNEKKQRLYRIQNRPLRPSIFLNDVNSFVNSSMPTISYQNQNQREESLQRHTEMNQESPEREYIRLPRIPRFSSIRQSPQTEVNELKFLSHQNSPIRNTKDTLLLEKKYFSKTPKNTVEYQAFPSNQVAMKKSVQFNPEIETINEAGLIGKEHLEITERQSRFKKNITRLRIKAH